EFIHRRAPEEVVIECLQDHAILGPVLAELKRTTAHWSEAKLITKLFDRLFGHDEPAETGRQCLAMEERIGTMEDELDRQWIDDFNGFDILEAGTMDAAKCGIHLPLVGKLDVVRRHFAIALVP